MPGIAEKSVEPSHTNAATSESDGHLTSPTLLTSTSGNGFAEEFVLACKLQVGGAL